MTTHAEMVEGVRDLVAEMTAAMEALQKRYPVSTFMAAMAARKCLESEQYGEAADLARVVLATVRGVPEGATKLGPGEITTLLAVVLDAVDQTRTESSEDTEEEAGARVAMLKRLNRLTVLLSGATAVYIAGDGEVDA
jgi:hypothetical protein